MKKIASMLVICILLISVFSVLAEAKIKRSTSAKKQFLKSHGLKKVPSGFQIDHIVPLFKGGADKPSNMRLISKTTHKQKTARERKR